jgi:NAD(P)-dependent dehydrogenase (short-subunit alcohol dehydrogenase family)
VTGASSGIGRATALALAEAGYLVFASAPMRRKGWGRIVNVSSTGGEFTVPYSGASHASKYAVEAISDALRFEVQPFGVEVIVI